MEPHVRAITTAIIDDVVHKGPCDFVVDIAAKLPVAVNCSMMGVERADWGLMFDLQDDPALLLSAVEEILR